MSRLSVPMAVLAFVLAIANGSVHAQVTVLDETRTISRGGPMPVERDFAVATAGQYRVVVSDLGLPAPLASLQVAITRADRVLSVQTAVGTTQFEAAAPGTYSVRIVGAPAASQPSGAVGVRIEPLAGGPPVLELAANIQAAAPAIPPNVRVVEIAVPIAAAGDYEITLADRRFPAPLSQAQLAVVRDGASALAVLLAAPGSAVFAATPGTYRVTIIAESPSTTNAGLFTVRLRALGSATVVLERAEPVGRVQNVGTVDIVQTGEHVLAALDIGFPVALASLGATLLRGVENVASLSAAGSASFIANAGEHRLFALASAAADNAGAATFAVRRASGPELASFTVTTSAAPALGLFAYEAQVPAAGTYRLRLADLEFPQTLQTLSASAVQGSATPVVLTAPGVTDVPGLQSGRVVILVAARAATTGSGSGLFGVELLPVSAQGAAVFDRTGAIGAAFSSTRLNIPTAASYEASLFDLRFPAAFSEIAVVVSRGTQRIGLVASGGSFPFFVSSPGEYVLSVVAQPNTQARSGTYRMLVAQRPLAPTVTLSAASTSVVRGGTTTLTWSSTGATSCSATGGWSGSRPTSGTETSPAISSSLTFTLSCEGGGGQASASVTVNPSAPEPPAAQGGNGGGGSIDRWLLATLALLMLVRFATLLQRRSRGSMPRG